MKGKLVKVLMVLVSVTMISSSIPKEVFANEVNTPKNIHNIECSNDVKRITQVNLGNPNNNTAPNGMQEIDKEISTYANTANYTMSDLNKMSYDELINTITSIEWYQIKDIFQYNQDAYEFYSNTSRFDAIVKALEERGKTYTATDHKGIPTLVEVIRAGFFLGFYNEPLKVLNERATHDKCLPAMVAIQSNINFKIGESGQNKVISALGLLIGNGSATSDIINKCAPILKDFNNNLDSYCEDYYKGDVPFQLLRGIEYEVTTYAPFYNVSIKDTPFYSNIDPFVNEVSRLALKGSFTDKTEWAVNNGIYYMGRLAPYYSNDKAQLINLEKCMSIYKYLSEQYFTAVERIVYDFNSTLSNGQRLDYDKMKSDGKSYYLPKTYTFDNGKLIIKAGDKITEDKIKRLYWASKEVNSQFFRILGNDKALEQGNKDDVLTMVIYNSPKEYKMNRYLNNLYTDNGGIYIEGDGTFYTYERTVNESIFSLEELFRHEYTHYLQGRYLVPGLWGTSDFYQGNSSRLTWFEEGSAEFFAGSTRKEDVKPRKSIVGGISWNPNDRFTTADLFNSGYGSWAFYNYGSAFTDYMYNDRKEMFKNIITYIERNDVKGYENYIKDLKADTNVNTQYQQHMQELVDKYDNLGVPLVSDDYVKTHSVKSLDQIKNDIVNATGITNATIVEEKTQFGSTFTLKGTYTDNGVNNVIDDWKLMNSKANEMLNNIDKLSWTGYKTVTNYFTNYKTLTAGKYQFDVVFTGVVSSTPTAFEVEDVNTDGKIDALDLSVASVRYNSNNTNTSYNSLADVNKDNIIDIFDIVRISKKIK